MRIPQSKIEEIKSTVDIVELVSQYVAIKQRGRNYVGLCPFHNEKTPSFTVNAEKQIFYCFGCGVGGDAISFIRNYEKVGYAEAIRFLAGKYNIDLPTGDSEEEEERRSDIEGLYFLHKTVARFYYDQLQSPNGAEARDYLKQRGLSEKVLTTFGIGYAPDRWDAVVEFAKARSIDQVLVEKAGLILPRKDGGFYDRFRHRVMFPIFNASGRVIAFGGRQLRDEQDSPKYVNSPESPIYHKGRTLYGLFQAREAIKEKDRILIVEGYADCLMLHQHGFRYATASSGTAFTVDQANLIRRFTQNVVLVYDGDAAGVRAAQRGGAVMLQAGLRVHIVVLPAEHDPDSFLRANGTEAFEGLVAGAEPYVDFRIHQWEREDKLSDVHARTQAARELLQVLAGLRDPIKASAFVSEIADRLRLDEIILRSELHKLSRQPVAPVPSEGKTLRPPEAAKPVLAERIQHAERGILRALLTGNPVQAQYIFSHLRPEDFQQEAIRRVVGHIYSQYMLNESYTSESVASAFPEDIQRAITRLLIDEMFAYDVHDCIAAIQLDQLEKKLESLRDVMQHTEESEEETAQLDEAISILLKQIHNLKTRKQLLPAGEKPLQERMRFDGSGDA